jgi:putative endonuclease
MSEAWVYLLRCIDGSLYTGWTVDLERRLARHRAGTASRYTASRLPVELACAIPMPDRTAARREEARIKRLPRADKLALLSRLGASAHPVSQTAHSQSAFQQLVRVPLGVDRIREVAKDVVDLLPGVAGSSHDSLDLSVGHETGSLHEALPSSADVRRS